MNVKVSAKFKTRIRDASTAVRDGGGKIVKHGTLQKESPWRHNLFLDQGLNNLARNTPNATSPAGCFSNLLVGSGTNPTSIASGAITFTQSGTTITASGGFFTNAMVGGIFKYGTGTGGAEYYIVTYTDSTHVVVDTSAAVAVPTVATIWQVQETQLQTPSYAAATYDTSSGACFTSFLANVVTMQRSFIFASGLTYTVNELGYNGFSLGSTTNNVNGRIVLPSSDVLGPSQYYEVILQLQFTYTPAAPVANGNVGTNIDTTGTTAIEFWAIQEVDSGGNTSGHGFLDGASSIWANAIIASYAQNGSIGTNQAVPTTTNVGLSSAAWNYTGTRGKMTCSISFTVSTSGQTMYGFGLTTGGTYFNGTLADVQFTTPFTLPTGAFSGNVVFSLTYGRTLSN